MNYQKNPVHIKSSCFDGRLGANEQRTEPYRKYGEGVAQGATTPGPKSSRRVLSFAQKQATATGGFYA